MNWHQTGLNWQKTLGYWHLLVSMKNRRFHWAVTDVRGVPWVNGEESSLEAAQVACNTAGHMFLSLFGEGLN